MLRKCRRKYSVYVIIAATLFFCWTVLFEDSETNGGSISTFDAALYLRREQLKINEIIQRNRSALLNLSPVVSSELFQKIFNASSNFDTLLYGYRRPTKGFLTIGLATGSRPGGVSYLRHTLRSIINTTTENDRKNTTVVILLTDYNDTAKRKLAVEIYNAFTEYCDSGFIHIINASSSVYPNFSTLSKTRFDKKARVMWRSKQNIDYSFLFLYSLNISEYYIQLEDDVICAPQFMDGISRFIEEKRGERWSCLEFSELGFIGKLFRSDFLPTMASGLIKSYKRQPCDILLGEIYRKAGQSHPMHYRPSLFQHIGKWSTLQNKISVLVDVNFKNFGKEELTILNTEKGDNPDARFETDMTYLSKHSPTHAYIHCGDCQFQGIKPKAGNYFNVILKNAQNIKRIVVSTGDKRTKENELVNGVMRFSKTFPCHAKSFSGMERFANGMLDTSVMGTKIPKEIHCIKIVVSAPRNQRKPIPKMLVISNIEVFLE